MWIIREFISALLLCPSSCRHYRRSCSGPHFTCAVQPLDLNPLLQTPLSHRDRIIASKPLWSLLSNSQHRNAAFICLLKWKRHAAQSWCCWLKLGWEVLKDRKKRRKKKACLADLVIMWIYTTHSCIKKALITHIKKSIWQRSVDELKVTALYGLNQTKCTQRLIKQILHTKHGLTVWQTLPYTQRIQQICPYLLWFSFFHGGKHYLKPSCS